MLGCVTEFSFFLSREKSGPFPKLIAAGFASGVAWNRFRKSGRVYKSVAETAKIIHLCQNMGCKKMPFRHFWTDSADKDIGL